MTKTEIKEKLDSIGIEYDDSALKEELEELLESATAAMGNGEELDGELETVDAPVIVESVKDQNADFNLCYKQMMTGLPFNKEE